jgi:hypothetical protein
VVSPRRGMKTSQKEEEEEEKPATEGEVKRSCKVCFNSYIIRALQ